MTRETVGQRIRTVRLLRGFSQTDIESLCGIPKARMSRYENDHVVPTLATLEQLAEVLSVSPAVLACWSDEM
jgi:transcriptional regulator with XRE-family HTH domain